MTAEGDLLLDGPGAVTTFVCAGYDYDQDVAQSLLSLLPAVLHVPADPVAGSQIAARGRRCWPASWGRAMPAPARPSRG